MNTDGNTAAIERMMADREEYDERREAEQELQDLRDEVDALAAKLNEVEAERDTAMRVVDENWVTHQEIVAARAALVTARNEALEEAAKVAVAYGKVQYSANIERHPQYASDAADDALEIANAIRAMPTPATAELMARIAQTTEGGCND